MASTRWLLAVLLLVGCGAKTGAEIGDGDAGRLPEGGFDTFPCRWSMAQATEVARDPGGFERLAGAVHGIRDEAAVVAWAVGARGSRGALLTLGDPPPLLRSIVLDVRGALHGHPSGWVELRDRAGGCTERFFDDRLGSLVRVLAREARTCVHEPLAPEAMDVTVITDEGVVLSHRPLPDGEAMDRPAVEGPVEWARSARLGAEAMVLYTRDGRLWAAEPGAGEPMALADHGGAFATALDRVRPAVLVLRRDPSGRWLLGRVPFAGAPALLPLADLSALGLEPTGTMVSNETEAMMPLADGRVAIAPVDGSAVRFVGPVPEALAGEMVVVMRPGSSGGGLLYQHRVGSESVLLFRPLTCNR